MCKNCFPRRIFTSHEVLAGQVEAAAVAFHAHGTLQRGAALPISTDPPCSPIGVCIGIFIGSVSRSTSGLPSQSHRGYIAVPSGLYIGVCIGVCIGSVSGRCQLASASSHVIQIKLRQPPATSYYMCSIDENRNLAVVPPAFGIRHSATGLAKCTIVLRRQALPFPPSAIIMHVFYRCFIKSAIHFPLTRCPARCPPASKAVGKMVDSVGIIAHKLKFSKFY
jgi:hypothetical protein